MAQGMCVYLMIRRKKTTIFTDAKETTNVSELKKIIQGTHICQKVEMFFRLNYTNVVGLSFLSGITKVAPENQRLLKEERVMEDSRCLADYGLISTTARAQSPASLTLTYR